MEKFSFNIPFSREDQDEYRAIQKLKKEADKRLKALTLKNEGHKDIQVATKLTRYPNAPKLTVTQSGITVDFVIMKTTIKDANAPPKPQTPPQFYMDPKTLNALLHGKLLDDTQKKGLLTKAHPGLCEVLSPPTPAP